MNPGAVVPGAGRSSSVCRNTRTTADFRRNWPSSVSSHSLSKGASSVTNASSSWPGSDPSSATSRRVSPVASTTEMPVVAVSGRCCSLGLLATEPPPPAADAGRRGRDPLLAAAVLRGHVEMVVLRPVGLLLRLVIRLLQGRAPSLVRRCPLGLQPGGGGISQRLEAVADGALQPLDDHLLRRHRACLLVDVA